MASETTPPALSTATWLSPALLRPTTSDLPIWTVRNGVIDLFSFTVPETMDFWMPARLPDPPKQAMTDAEKCGRLYGLFQSLYGAVQSVDQLSEAGARTGSDADYLSAAISNAVKRAEEIMT